MKGLFMTGTDTDVGKTWVGSRLITQLKKLNINVKARKPIESGWPNVENTENIEQTDAWTLANAMGEPDNVDAVCPYRFNAAISPDRAAMLEGEEITLEQLKRACLAGINKSDFLYVEGAGGFYSPLCSDALNADLALALKLPVLLVVEDRLGCINQTLLNVEAIKSRGLTLAAIVLNRSNNSQDELAMDNLADIQKRVECEVFACGYKQNSSKVVKQLARLFK